MKGKSIKVNAFFNILYTVINIIFPLIIYPYVNRILMAAGLGKVTFYASVSNYAIMFAGLGLATYGVRAVAKVRENGKELSGIAAELLRINMVATVVVVVIYTCFVLFSERLNKEQCLFWINGILIITAPLGVDWLYSGLEQYSYITKRTVLFKAVSLVLVFLFVRQSDDYIVYAGILAFSNIASILCNYLYAKKLVGFSLQGEYRYKKHLKPMMVLFASALAVSIYTNLDTVMLGFICDDREVGLYTVAVKVKTVLLAVVNAISTVLLPRLSCYYGQEKYGEYYKVLKKSVSVIFMLTIPLAMFFALEAYNCIFILGGEDYLQAVSCMQILMPVLVMSGFSNVTGNQVLIPQGKDTLFMRAVMAGAFVDIVLNALFMRRFGCIGASVATLIAEMVQMGVQLFYSYKDVVSGFQLKTFMHIGIASVISFFVVCELEFLCGFSVIAELFISAFIYFFCYSIIMAVFGEENILAVLEWLWIKIKHIFGGRL